MKTCKTCGETKLRDGFYRASRAADGLMTECKTCSKARARRWRYNNHERVMNSWRAKERSPEQLATAAEIQRESKRRYPEKWKARAALNNAIAAGKMIRQPCSECGAKRAQGHHHDYSKPLDVEWLCVACHGVEHRVSEEGLAHASANKPSTGT